MPEPIVALPCGSRSMTSTRWPSLRQPGGEVDGGGGLADPAFLVGDAEDARHACILAEGALQSGRRMPFDAESARALSRRVHSLQDCLFVIKQAVVQAAKAGEFEVTVGLSDPLPVVAGQSTNNAAFVIDFLHHNGRGAWAEAAAQAARAGYTVRPAWGRVATGAALEGMTLSWKSVEEPDATMPRAAGTPPLMPASQAQAISEAEQAHVRWVEARHEALQRAARQGRTSVTLHDATPAAAPEWTQRREILRRAGFTTELIAGEAGATLVVRW